MTPDYPRRYDIYRADLNPTVGAEIQKTRPVVIVSRNEMNGWLDALVVCPLTARLHPRLRGRLQVRCAGEEAEIAPNRYEPSANSASGTGWTAFHRTTQRSCGR